MCDFSFALSKAYDSELELCGVWSELAIAFHQTLDRTIAGYRGKLKAPLLRAHDPLPSG
jgi:hypothetical protein